MEEKSIEGQRGNLFSSAAWIIVAVLPLLFYPFSNEPFEGPKYAFLKLVIIAVLVVVGLDGGRALGTAYRKLGVYQKPVIVLIAVYFFSLFFSLDFWQSFWGDSNSHFDLTSLVSWILLFAGLMMWLTADPSNKYRLIDLLILTSVPISLYGIIQFFGFDPIVWKTDAISPVHATIGRSIYLGTYLAALIPFTLAKIFRDPRGRIQFAFIFLLQTVCILMTLARSAWLATILSLIIFFIVHFRERLIYLIITSVIIIIIGLIGYPLIQSGNDQFFTSENIPSAELFEIMRESSDSIRIEILRNSYLISNFNNRIWGAGPATFHLAYQTYLPEELREGPYLFFVSDPHNTLLRIFTNLGLIGLIAWGLLLSVVIHQAWKLWHSTLDGESLSFMAAVFGSFATIFVQNMLNPNLSVHIMLFWILVALTYTLYIENIETQNI